MNKDSYYFSGLHSAQLFLLLGSIYNFFKDMKRIHFSGVWGSHSSWDTHLELTRGGACHYAFFNEKFYIQYILIIFFPLTLNFSQRPGIPKSLYFREQIWCMFNTSHDDPSNIDSKTTPLTNTATVKHMRTHVSWDKWNPTTAMCQGRILFPNRWQAQDFRAFADPETDSNYEVLMLYQAPCSMSTTTYPPPALQGARLTPMSLMMKPYLTGL